MATLNYLYVEDDRLSRDVMQILMREVAGITTCTIFETSEDFLQRIKALPQRPDVFFLDIHIAPLDGFSMLELIRAEPDLKHCRVIAVTASVMNEEVQKLRTSGFDGTIGKPLDASTFQSLMARIEAGETIWEIA